MCKARIFGTGVPMEIAAVTKGCSFKVSTTLRTSRTMRGRSGTMIAMMMVVRPPPSSEASAIASSTPGMAISPSIRRMTMRSPQRKYPA